MRLMTIMHKFLQMLFWLFLSLILSSCNKTGQSLSEQIEQTGKECFNFSTNEEWQDNSMDAYSASFIFPVYYTVEENALQGGAEQYVLGKGRAIAFKKHLFSEVDNCWDEINVISDEGEAKSFRLAFWKDYRNQAWAIGKSFNDDGYWFMNVETDETHARLYHFFKVDEEMNILQSLYVHEMDQEHYEIPYQILEDAEGKIHALTTTLVDDELYHNYYVISSEGVILNKATKTVQKNSEPELFCMHEGRIGIRMGRELFLAKESSGETEFFAELKFDCSKFIFLDENTLIYADKVGLHRCSMTGGETETLYVWENHGIVFSIIHDMKLFENQSIGLLYGSQEGVSYIKLEQTTEQVPVTEIEFAVTAFSFQKYQSVVAEFNRNNPTYKVKMRQYTWNDTGLLTKLIAGEGPQLLDSGVTGFANHIEWWESLDDYYHQLNLDAELIPQTVEMGKIDDTIYGAVTNFYVYTMITFLDSPDNWNYEKFLDYLMEKQDEGKAYINELNGNGGLTCLGSFYHGPNENILYDVESCETHFDGEYFQKMLRLAKQYDQEENQGDMEDLKRGNAPCAVIAIFKPEDLACLRIWGEEQLRFVGFPTQDGSVNYLACDDPLCVRKNSKAEEKQIALSFISFLLSRDVQKKLALTSNNLGFHLSVQSDVLDMQMNYVDENAYPYVSGIPQFNLGDGVNIEKDSETLCDLLNNSRPRIYASKELCNILREEFEDYLIGSISEKELKSHLKNRVELYIREQK